ncbi:MAG: DNA primase [Facklamia hominis]
MVKIPNEVIDRVRQAVRIEEVVGHYVELKKRGQNYVASCPFHEDRNPSFSIHTQKQIYKCFSCGRGGNVFGFLQEIESISFVQAVKRAAELAHLELDKQYFQEDPGLQIDPQKQSLYRIHEKVQEFYAYYLVHTQNGQAALDYLHDRKLKDDTIRTFGLGLAPENSELVLAYLEQEAFSKKSLLDSGIFYLDQQNRLQDRFSGRIIFPLRNRSGKPIAFSGRRYRPADDRGAKYINSPETDLFQKSKLIYNLDLAQSEIRKQNQILICEGYLDVISLYQAGFQQVVASMGTSLTRDHLAYLTKLANELIFVFDGDQAGQNATIKAFQLTTDFKETRFKAIKIPQEKDPDEFIKLKGAPAFGQLIHQAFSYYEFYKEYRKGDFNLKDAQGLSQYIESLLKILSTVQSPIERQLYVGQLAQEYDLDSDLLEEQLARIHPAQSSASSFKQSSKTRRDTQATIASSSSEVASSLPIKSQAAFQAEKVWLGQLIFYEDSWNFVNQQKQMPLMYHSFAQKAFNYLCDYYYEGHPFPLTGIVDQMEDPQVNQLLTSILWDHTPLDYQVQTMPDCLAIIYQAFKQQEIEELKVKLSKYTKEQDQELAKETILKIMTIERQLKKKN